METVHSEVGDDEPSRLKVMDKQLNVSSRIIAQDYDTDEMNIQHEYDLVKEEELETKHRYKEKRDKKEKKDKKDKKERKRLKKERKRKEKQAKREAEEKEKAMLESTNKQDLSRDSSLKHNEMANNTGNQITDTKMQQQNQSLSLEKSKKSLGSKQEASEQRKYSENSRRGRKSVPVKRKKMSICERQNIINRKFRVKKKCSFLNKLSERKWGPFKNDRKDRDESDQYNRSRSQSTKEKKSKGQEINDEPKKEKVTGEQQNDQGKSVLDGQNVKAKRRRKQTVDKKKEEAIVKDEETQNPGVKLEENNEVPMQIRPKRKKIGRPSKVQKQYQQMFEDEQEKQRKVLGQKRKVMSPRITEAMKNFTREQSQHLIDLFSINGGDYEDMKKAFPGIKQKKIRDHLRMLFFNALRIITQRVQTECNRKIKEWDEEQRIQIVRQMLRIRNANRLMSEAAEPFRNKMTELIRSYNDPSRLANVSNQDIQQLYRRIEAFARGYNMTVNRSAKKMPGSANELKARSIKEQRYKFSKEVTRRPIKCGGHLLSKGLKKETQADDSRSIGFERESKEFDHENKLLNEWSREEEEFLCKLYSQLKDSDEIRAELETKFGPKLHWRDFELVNNKIDQIIKYALVKLQKLTIEPYNRADWIHKASVQYKKLSQKNTLQYGDSKEYMDKYYQQRRRKMSMFCYDNQIFQKDERADNTHRIFKDCSKIERLIFGYRIDSCPLRRALLSLLVEDFPLQEKVENAVRVALQFTKWVMVHEESGKIAYKTKALQDIDCDDLRPQDRQIMVDLTNIQIIKPTKTEQEWVEEGDRPPKTQKDLPEKIEGLDLEIDAKASGRFKALQRLFHSLNDS